MVSPRAPASRSARASPINSSMTWAASIGSFAGRRLRPVLPEVLLVLPLQRQAVHEGTAAKPSRASAPPAVSAD